MDDDELAAELAAEEAMEREMLDDMEAEAMMEMEDARRGAAAAGAQPPRQEARQEAPASPATIESTAGFRDDYADREAAAPSAAEVAAAEREAERRRVPFVERLMARRALRETAVLPRREREDMIRFLYLRPGENVGGDIRVTLPNGSMKYMLVDLHKARDRDSLNNTRGSSYEREDGSMLGRPFQELLDELDARRRDERLRALETGGSSQGSDDAALLDGLNSQPEPAGGEDASAPLASKYAPRRFLDLVSHERTNRAVMQWMMSWRPFVFEGARHARPEYPVILLAGPPGAGKTTLAHVIAQHAGYNPVEINASDERTADVLSNRLINAMEMQSVFGEASGKPNCVILDEFEGVANQGEGRGAVQALLDMIQTPVANSNRTRRGASGAAASNSSKARPISRPVILICNDPYVPALRTLRRAVKMVTFRAAPQARIVQRLKEICLLEKIAPQHGALELLAERQDYDIRACLNTLQFIVSERGARPFAAGSPRQASPSQRFRLEVQDVEDLCVGTKDQTSDLFKSWDAVFHNARRQQKWTRRGGNEQMQQWAQFGQHVSEFSKFLEGIHENMCGVRLADASMANLHAAVELFGDADMILNRVGSSQQWTLSQYLAPTALSLRRLLGTESKTFLRFPMAHATYTRRRMENEETLAVFAEGRRTLLPGGVVGGRHNLVLDALTPIAIMLNPRVRAIPWNLLSPNEQASVQHTLDVMLSLGLTLHKTFEDVPFAASAKRPRESSDHAGGGDKPGFNPFRRVTYKPGPRIDKLLTFGDSAFSYEEVHGMPSLTVCEMLLQRLRVARVKDTSSLRSNASDGIVERRMGKLSSERQDPAGASSGKANKRSASATAAAGAVDFFGRAITAKNAGNRKRIVARKAGGADDPAASDHAEEGAAAADTDDVGPKRKKKSAWVEYRFQEGFTNAVRRPVDMDDFLGISLAKA